MPIEAAGEPLAQRAKGANTQNEAYEVQGSEHVGRLLVKIFDGSSYLGQVPCSA